jgi:D-tyrosyl-tRNA(Tyr) deacylase
MPADLASNAAAVAEGYVRTQIDRGAGAGVRYETWYEKSFDGDAQFGGLRLIGGQDNTSQANADANALASLNGFRRSTFGTDSKRQRGTRPDFSKAAPKHEAEPLYERFCEALAAAGVPVERGVFGARMELELVNDGPVTIILET